MALDFENKVLLGDCLDVLRLIPDATFDSCVTDPPYGLGTEPTVDEIIAYLQGADLVTGDFMGKDWDIPSVPTWREIYRVLRPGAHVLCFGGTRTFDLIAIGARAAGFERRDTIAEDHPGLQWIQSQGMPKSHNVSKDFAKKGLSVEAEKWAGSGTGLKPTWEPILVLRKPLEGTIAANILKHSTGTLNIDGCRVKHASAADFEQHKAGVEALKARGGSMQHSWKNSSDLSGANDVKTEGRWPPNLVLTHAPGCRRVGGARIKALAPAGKPCADEEGKDTIESLECTPDCPVRMLDEQSGNRRATLAGRADPHQAHEHPGIDTTSESMWFGKDRTFLGRVYADEGGASRYFPQFEGQQPVEAPFFYSGKATRKETSLNGRIENDHLTRKPLKLMQWLVRLVTPKNGLVLDPYCGSGSTLHAAVKERLRYTGIEKDTHAHEIASKRMAIVVEESGEKHTEQDLFDQIMSGELDE